MIGTSEDQRWDCVSVTVFEDRNSEVGRWPASAVPWAAGLRFGRARPGGSPGGGLPWRRLDAVEAWRAAYRISHSLGWRGVAYRSGGE